MSERIAELEAELLAEREKVERMSKAYMVCNQDWQTATEQLDAERERVKELSTALRLLKIGATSKIDRKVAAVALEKVSDLNKKPSPLAPR